MMMVVRLFDPWTGGMEKQSLTLAHALARDGHHIRILTGRWFPGTPRRQSYQGVEVIRNGAIFDAFGIRGLRRLAAVVYMLTLAVALYRHRRTYDVIHVHGLSYHAYVAVLVGRRLGKPVIIKLANSGTASDITKMKTGQHIFFSRYLLPTALGAERFVALNSTIRAELEAEGVSPAQIVEIPNGVEIPDRLAPVGADDTDRVVSFVGRLHEQKAVDVLIRGFAKAQRALGTTARLWVIGDGPARSSIERLVSELGAGDEIELLGEVTDVDPLLHETDLMALPSVAEGMSNALLEAMARGIPVVASDIAPNAALIDHGESGWLFPVSDSEGLADVLIAVLDDAELLRSVGLEGRRIAAERFGIDRVADRYAQLYRGLSREAS